ncbi:MAG: bifunctional heptose 7-phosphate kinase/heptose 1-phosphate adenyltransferase [Kiritimatiellia bacterium]|jgi:rfaE bifunctional protein kinase chain/domain
MIQRLDTLEAILKAIQGRRILVIGDAMLDNYIWGDTSRISPEAPVPVVKVSHETYTAGGAANVALNITALGGHATLFGWIGDDPSGRRLVDVVNVGGVDVLDGAVSDRHETIVKTRIVCRRQQICRLDREAGPEHFTLPPDAVRNILAPALREADAVILSDYGKGLVTTESIRAIQAAAPAGMFIALDPKPRSGITYSGLSVITPNRVEALRMAGLDDDGAFPADAVFANIRERHRPEHLVVTMGADGMLIGENGRPVEQIPTVAREVFDVSGAGDTVIAALTLAASAGVSLGDAAKFANTAAGFVVGKVGTATATPDDIRRYAAEAGA